MLHLIIAAIAMLVMTILGIEGVDWITLGYGLNPWVAFPLASLCGFLGYVQTKVFVEEALLAEEYQARKQ